MKTSSLRKTQPLAPSGSGKVRIQNWAGTIQRDVNVMRPRDVGQLRAYLRDTQGPIRFGGSLHSWSTGAMPPKGGVQIDMRGLDQVLDFKPQQSIRAQPGIQMKTLYALLDAHDSALAMIPSSGAITLGGALANGVHGAGSKYPAVVSDHALALEFMRTNGQGGLTLTDSSNHMRGAAGLTDLQLGRTHLGSLGALTAATMKLVPAYDVEVNVSHHNRKAYGRRLDDLMETNDHHLVFWYPGANDVFKVNTYDHVPRSSRNRPGAPPFITEPKATDRDLHLERRLHRLAMSNSQFALRLSQMWANRGATTTQSSWHIGPREASTVAPHDVSYAVPPDQMHGTLNDLNKLFRRVGYPPVELWIRLVGKSDSAMTASFDGPKAMIEYFPMQAGPEAYQQRLISEARKVFADHGGIRHWAKEGEGGLSAFPADRTDAFRSLAMNLDPDARLHNPFTRQIGL